MLRRIGGGRRYEAMLVWDEHRLAVLVAKVLRPDQASEPAALRDLAHEAELLARLAHPVVVRGFGAVLDGRFPHLVLEHLDGPTLDELLERDGALALEQLLPLGLHVASALHYLAAEAVVHLDVKPSNVVMGGPPRLIDLSVARTHARGARGCAPRSAPTPTWRPSSARRTGGSARRPTSSASPRRSTRAVGRPAAVRVARGRARAARAAPAPHAARARRRCCAPALTLTRPRAPRPRSWRPVSSRSSPRCRTGSRSAGTKRRFLSSSGS